MSSFRYDTSGQWFKGNCHVHTTHSDGGKTPEELAALYARAGYDFLVRADHWVSSDVAAEPDNPPLLWLDGMELDGENEGGEYYHVVVIGKVSGMDREMGLHAAMETARKQGAFLVLAHPAWCGNPVEDALRMHFHGVEIYNHVCRWLNGKGDGLVHWDQMAEQQPHLLGLAVDDAHVKPEHPGWNGGWVMVNAAECSREAIFAAIRTGNFYASQGPEFHAIEGDAASVTVRTSPVSFVRLVGPRTHGRRIGSFEGKQFTEATFEIPEDWATARVEIEDASGRRAWTNPLLVTP